MVVKDPVVQLITELTEHIALLSEEISRLTIITEKLSSYKGYIPLDLVEKLFGEDK